MLLDPILISNALPNDNKMSFSIVHADTNVPSNNDCLLADMRQQFIHSRRVGQWKSRKINEMKFTGGKCFCYEASTNSATTHKIGRFSCMFRANNSLSGLSFLNVCACVFVWTFVDCMNMKPMLWPHTKIYCRWNGCRLGWHSSRRSLCSILYNPQYKFWNNNI